MRQVGAEARTEGSSVVLRVVEEPTAGQAGDDGQEDRLVGIWMVRGRARKRVTASQHIRCRQSKDCGSDWSQESKIAWGQDCDFMGASVLYVVCELCRHDWFGVVCLDSRLCGLSFG
jgi:hypothetical protein